jgi:hypothetical protein
MATRISNTIPRHIGYCLYNNFHIADHLLLDHWMILLGMIINRVTGSERLQTKTILNYDNCLGADFLTSLGRIESFDDLSDFLRIVLSAIELRARCPWMNSEISPYKSK